MARSSMGSRVASIRAASTALLALARVCLASAAAPSAAALPSFDFSAPENVANWQPTHDVAQLRHTTEGLAVTITGTDPYFTGPARSFPAGVPLWALVRLKSDAGGSAQLFYFAGNPTEEHSIRFNVPPGEWHEAKLPLPALGARYRLRIDPPGDAGSFTLAGIWFESRVPVPAPTWPSPTGHTLDNARLVSVKSGTVELRHHRDAWGVFELLVNGQLMARGHDQQMLGYTLDGSQRWLGLTNHAGLTVNSSRVRNGFEISAHFRDPDGARWQLTQRFTTAPTGAIAVQASAVVDQPREVVYLPLVTMVPGLGSFGTNKTQGLFCGLEYLDNEPSSSEADIIGPESRRQVPDTIKVTIPLMAISAMDRYIGLIWEPDQDLAAVFDSPDRLFSSGAHIMGIIFPGSMGANREEGNLMPYKGTLLKANVPLVLRATLIGGAGQSIVPAVQHYVALRGLPPLPSPGLTADEYFRLAARGWLDSLIQTNALFRHASWPGFNAQPAADAAVFLAWLAQYPANSDLQPRLTTTSAQAIQQLSRPGNFNHALISHLRYPLPALHFNAVADNVESARATARSVLAGFEPDGTVRYRPRSGQVDYGRTHFAPDANGLTAATLETALEAAAFSGDADLIASAIRQLRALEKFRDTVPRGAQTWEIPLHTPDILASAKLLRCYTLGYELTGEMEFLEQAKYWAWTGVPFIYLTPPTQHPVGIYGTIPVLGATTWVGSWFGRPVQWCGLVYADALYRFAQYDANGPWMKLADGITASAIQQCWTETDPERMGLLPDFFLLRPQQKDGPAINPGTVQPAAVRYYGLPPMYDFRSFRMHQVLVHAPGAIEKARETAKNIEFVVNSWSTSSASVLVTGLKRQPSLRINGKDASTDQCQTYDPKNGTLILQIKGRTRVSLSF